MTAIDALKMSFQSPISQTAKSSKQKMDSATTKEGDVFSKLLDSMSVQEQPITEQPAELLEELEKVLLVLEQLPQEELSVEQQDILAAILQTLTLQTEQLEIASASNKEAVLENPLSKIMLMDNQSIKNPIADEISHQKTMITDLSLIKDGLDLTSEEAPSTSSTSESQPAVAELQGKTGNNELMQEKIRALLQQIDQKIEGLSTAVPEGVDEVQKLVELDGKTIPADAKKIEQLFKKLADFIRQFDPEQSTEGKQTSFKQLEQVLQQLTGMTPEPESGMQGKEIPSFNTQATDAVRTGLPSAAFQQESTVLQVETVQKVEHSPAPPAAPLDGAKAAALSRPETAAPTAAVRMSNLIADLSDVLRGSMRLTGSGDSAQIKVSIFPEHLGHLDIRLTTTDGKIAAQIFTSNVMAKEALELQVNQLRTLLTQQGMTVDRIEITQQSSQQSFGQQNGHSDQQFSQQQKQGTAGHKNGYQVIEDETAAMERASTSDGAVMKIDYTI